MFGVEKSDHLGGYICGGDINTSATEIWDQMIDSGIKSLLDIGCGEGHSTKYFYNKGIDVLGIEGGQNAINNSPIKDKIILHDYTKGPFIPEKKFDAIWCCEFVEHVYEEFIENFLSTFDYTNTIYMTHATPGQGGYHHVNEQPQEYWIHHICKRGFIYDKNLSLYLRSITKAKWVKNTLLVFKK
jgi:hypothetical protein